MAYVDGSEWDLRRPVQREKLKKALAKLLRKNGKSTKELASEVGCSTYQARKSLNELCEEGAATYSGNRRTTQWHAPEK